MDENHILEFIEKVKISLCISSPLSKLRIFDSPSDEFYQKIKITLLKNCSYSNLLYLKDQSEVGKHVHCRGIDEFIKGFGLLKEVKEAVRTGKDTSGVGEAFELFVNTLEEIVYDKKEF